MLNQNFCGIVRATSVKVASVLLNIPLREKEKENEASSPASFCQNTLTVNPPRLPFLDRRRRGHRG
jgi:hypothetical protein